MSAQTETKKRLSTPKSLSVSSLQPSPTSSSSSLTTKPPLPDTSNAKDQGQHLAYLQYKNKKVQQPKGFYNMMWSKIEMVFIYLWVLIQTLFLIAGLTVLHFSTFSVMVCYLVNGKIKGRRELLPQT